MNFKKNISVLSVLALTLTLGTPFTPTKTAEAATIGDVVINEIAWMGTTSDANDEWIELYNPRSTSVQLDGWSIKATDGTPNITLKGTIPAQGYFLLERTDDTTVAGMTADQVYVGALGNTGENLELRNASGLLIDSVNAWHGGDNTSKSTMERKDAATAGTTSTNWNTSTKPYVGGNGTPKGLNSSTQSSGTIIDDTDTTTDSGLLTEADLLGAEVMNQSSEAEGAINVYFNKPALTQYANSSTNKANYNVNFEKKMLNRLNNATTSIEVSTYEINLENMVDALILKASQGVDVRVVADAKAVTEDSHGARYNTMRLYLEEMIRGKDGKVGTADDIYIISDSPIFAYEEVTARQGEGLPASPSDLPQKTLKIGSTTTTGYLVTDGERKTDGTYYSPDNQMHNKFTIIDNRWVMTGSWNYTDTCTYGNSNHLIEINSPELAGVYRTEFNEMFGSSSLTPDPVNADFHGRKIDNTQKVVYVGGKKVEVYFSPGDNALQRLRDIVKYEADKSAYFTIFAWSDQQLADELKYKWEGSYTDLQGTRTGFDVKGVFDAGFWNSWWSPSVDMTGRTASQVSVDNPNTRWKNVAPVYASKETRKLHSKTMIIDADTTSDPTVVLGSTNWSVNGNDINDENMIIIHDTNITNQFVQEFYGRYQTSGGQLPN